MKKVLFIAFMAIVSLHLQAVVHPDTWHSLIVDMAINYEHRTYELGKDTIINNQTYTPVIYTDVSHGPDHTSTGIMYLLRYEEDYAKVYIHVDSTLRLVCRSMIEPYMIGDDVLVYDYTAQVGDTIYTIGTACGMHFPLQNVVLAVDTINDRRHIRLSQQAFVDENWDDYELYFSEDLPRRTISITWIEGLSLEPVTGVTECTNDFAEVLFCAFRGDELLYRMDDDSYYGYYWQKYHITSPCHEVTAIEETFSPQKDNTIPYNLLGQPVDDTYHGIVIQNGQKRVQ